MFSCFPSSSASFHHRKDGIVGGALQVRFRLQEYEFRSKHGAGGENSLEYPQLYLYCLISLLFPTLHPSLSLHLDALWCYRCDRDQ